jgi:hypothetical protein
MIADSVRRKKLFEFSPQRRSLLRLAAEISQYDEAATALTPLPFRVPLPSSLSCTIPQLGSHSPRNFPPDELRHPRNAFGPSRTIQQLGSASCRLDSTSSSTLSC